jgi:uncharacterized protein
MEQRLSVITVACTDVSAIKTFYEDTLGWTAVAGNRDLVFFKLNGFLISFCDRKLLTEFIGVGDGTSSFRGITFGYNVGSEEEVIRLFNTLRERNVDIIKAPTRPPFGGLFFYFRDIEGNIIEVACNDFVILDAEGNAVGHKNIDHL